MNHGEPANSSDTVFFIALPLGMIRRPDNGQALALIETTRKHALRAYRSVVHDPNADISVLFKPVTTWLQIADLFTHDLVTVLSNNATETCRHAPVGAAAIAAWRSVILSAVCYRDGEISFNTLAHRAALAERLCEWISSSGLTAALDHR